MNTTRRGVLIGISVGSASFLPSVSTGEDKDGECERLAQALEVAMAKRHGGEWQCTVDHEFQFVLISPIE